MADQLSVKELKENLRDALKNSGVLGNVKAKIRKEFITEMSKSSKPSMPKLGSTLLDRVLYSLIFGYLQSKDLENSLSVFVAECGHNRKDFWLSDHDIITALRIGTSSDAYKHVMESPESSSSDKPLVQYFIETMLNKSGTVDQMVQTVDNGVSPLESVENYMRNIRDSYSVKLCEGQSRSALSFEERYISIERECEDRYRKKLDIQLAFIRENEVSKVRMEERRSARQEIDALRLELEGDYKRRVQAYAEKELEQTRFWEEKERQWQRSMFESRQEMQKELESLRSREDTLVRKSDLESQGLKLLEMRIHEAQNSLEMRERDFQRRQHEEAEKMKLYQERIHREAQEVMEAELQTFYHEKMKFQAEKQRFDDERMHHDGMLQSATLYRDRFQEAQRRLLASEDELQTMKSRIVMLETLKEDWENQLQQVEFCLLFLTFSWLIVLICHRIDGVLAS